VSGEVISQGAGKVKVQSMVEAIFVFKIGVEMREIL